MARPVFSNGRARPAIATVTALSLLVAGLAFLHVGQFIQFDDISGFGSDDWVMPLGVLAGFTAAGSVVVASADRTARRLLGSAMMVLDLLVIWQAWTNDGFRFVWAGDEGELLYFQLALGMTALVLMTPRFYTTSTSPGSSRQTVSMSGWVRALAYVGSTLIVVFAAFFLGTAHFESTQCSGPNFDGECDVAAIAGFLWAAAAVVLMAVAVATLEVLRRRRAPARSKG